MALRWRSCSAGNLPRAAWSSSAEWLAGLTPSGHQGATDADGRAIGVLGTGIDVYYPKENKKLVVTYGADVIEELPTPIRAALVQAEQPEAEQRNLLAAAALNGSEKKL
jgi:hypothetical protein